MNSFVQSYIDALCSIMSDENGTGELKCEWEDLSESEQKEVLNDCENFQEEHSDYFSKLDSEGLSQMGYDFYLTRNRHGAGFWDRGLGEIGNKLNKSAHIYGSQHVMSDGKNYWLSY